MPHDIRFNDRWRLDFTLLLSRVFGWSDAAAAAWVAEVEADLSNRPDGEVLFAVCCHQSPGRVIIEREIMPLVRFPLRRPAEGLHVRTELETILRDASHRLHDDEGTDVSAERAAVDRVLRQLESSLQALQRT